MNINNQRAWFDEVGKTLDIRTPSDWGKVTVKHVEDLGGGPILCLYRNSLFRALQGAYSGKRNK